MVGGNYSPPNSSLPTSGGYQNVGRVIEVGTDVEDIVIGDIVYSSSDHYQYCNLRPHNLDNLMPHQRHDGLLIKLDNRVDLTHAALFGVASVAMRCCRNADLKVGLHFLVLGAGMVGQMAAQIGSMKVTEQLDALEVMGISSFQYLAVPRIIAASLCLPMLSSIFLFVGNIDKAKKRKVCMCVREK